MYYVINSYKRSIAAFDDVCLRVYWMDWMFTQPLNYGFFTVPFLIWHPLSFPQQSIISSMAISESQRTQMRPGRAFTSSFSSSREVIFLFLVMMLLSSLLKTVSTKLFIVVQLSISVHRNNVVFSISGESWVWLKSIPRKPHGLTWLVYVWHLNFSSLKL